MDNIETNPEEVVSLKTIVVGQLGEDGGCKFGGNDTGEKCLDL